MGHAAWLLNVRLVFNSTRLTIKWPHLNREQVLIVAVICMNTYLLTDIFVKIKFKYIWIQYFSSLEETNDYFRFYTIDFSWVQIMLEIKKNAETKVPWVKVQFNKPSSKERLSSTSTLLGYLLWTSRFFRQSMSNALNKLLS